MQDVILKAENLTFGFGEKKILRDVSFEGRKGKIYGLYGANGSGKTTLFNLLSGFLKPTTGHIVYFGQRPKSINPLTISRLAGGLSRSFQVPAVVNSLSIIENLMLAFRVPGEGVVSLFFRGKHLRVAESAARKQIISLLEQFDLSSKQNLQGGELSFGERRLVSILQAILTGAQILLLDEAFANLNIKVVNILQIMFREIAETEGRFILMIEHRPDNIVNFVDGLFHLHQHTLEVIDKNDFGKLSTLFSHPGFCYE